MPTTRPDISVQSSKGWVDAYPETGIAPSTKVRVQNKGPDFCLLAQGATPPADEAPGTLSEDGFLLKTGASVIVEAEANIWLRTLSSRSLVNVEELA